MTVSNKKLGNLFEVEVVEFLADKNYWVYHFPNRINGQPFDILTIKNNQVIAIDCIENKHLN